MKKVEEFRAIIEEELKIQGDLFPDEQKKLVEDMVDLFNKCTIDEQNQLLELEKEGLRLTKKLGHLLPHYDRTSEVSKHQKRMDTIYGKIYRKHLQ